MDELTNTDFNLFPNPTQDFVVIEGQDLKSVSVFDVLGKQYINQVLSSPTLNKINLGDLSLIIFVRMISKDCIPVFKSSYA